MPKTKPPILYIHGFRGSPAGNAEIVAILRKNFEVYSPKIPPTGARNKLETYDADSYAKFVADYIQEHKLRRPVLVGHSMGSIIAAATAERYPNLINKKLILVSPITAKVPKPIALLQPSIVFLPKRLISYATTRFLFVPHQRALFKKALALTNKSASSFSSRRDLRKSASFASKYSLNDFDFKQDLLLIAGEKDRLTSEETNKEFAQTHFAKLRIVDDAGHLINYERPTVVAKLIEDFVK